MLKNIIVSALVALLVAGGALLVLNGGGGNFAGVTHLSGLSIGTSGLKVGSSGSTVTSTKIGNCTIFAYATTIAASSTANVDCQGGAAALTAISGIQAGDFVFVQMPTTTPTTFEGLQLRGASASTTSGYIHLKLYNGTGTTYTWTAAASSSIQYRDSR